MTYNHYGGGGDGSHEHPHTHFPEQQHEIGEPKNPDRPVQNYFFEEEFFLNPLDYDYTETNPRSQADDVNIDIDLAWA